MNIEILTKEQVTESLQNNIAELYNQLDDSVEQLSIKQILDKNENLVVVICRKDDNVAGIALLATYKVLSGHKGIVEDVVVDETHRGKGLGRKLMEKLLEEARNRNLEEVLLFSGHHRKPAINLYKSLGFQLKNSGLYRLILN